jgi:hypothetical protein
VSQGGVKCQPFLREQISALGGRIVGSGAQSIWDKVREQGEDQIAESFEIVT